jgi:hypothetical protein
MLLCALAFACAGCSSDGTTASPSAATVTSSSLPSPPSSPITSTIGPSPTSTVQPDVHLPSGMAPVVEAPEDIAAISAGDLTPLVPAGSSVGNSAVLATPEDPLDQVAVAWASGDPATRRSGLIVWQRADAQPAWEAVYAFVDPKGRGVFGVRMDQGDVTHDGIADLLTFEDVGGSGACGTYRVIATTDGDASEIFRRDVCDAEIQIAGRDLRVREAVFEPDDPHCCPSAFRTTVLRWNGSDWAEVSEEVSAVPNAG